MAPVLDYLAAAPPSASALPPISATAICSLSGARVSMKLPEFRGLKAKSSVSSGGAVRSVKSNVRIVRRGGVVVCESQETAVEVPPLTEAAWQSKVLDSDTPVLVEFWAQWCGPCRMIHPHVEELAKQYTGKLKCFKVNTDECPEIASRYGIRSIPTVMIFKNGEKKDAIIGAVPKSTLATNIEKFL